MHFLVSVNEIYCNPLKSDNYLKWILTLFWLRRIGDRIEAAVIGGIKALCKLIWTVVPTTDQVGKTVLIRIAIPLKKTRFMNFAC